MDHRGTGRSRPLSCGYEAQEVLDGDKGQACGEALGAENGASLQHFSSSNAARDLHLLLESVRRPNTPVFVYGVSYGTWLVNRLLQLSPKGIAGVVLDSLCTPGTCDLLRYDRSFDEVGHQLLEMCADEAACASRFADFNGDPKVALEALYASIDAGTVCANLPEEQRPSITRQSLRRTLATLLMDGLQRQLIPALIYRYLRCSQSDVTVIDGLPSAAPYEAEGKTDDPQGECRVEDSEILGVHVCLSELVGSEDLESVSSATRQSHFSLDRAIAFARLRDSGSWPIYESDASEMSLADTNIPMLILNGELDPQTPIAWARAASEHFKLPQHHFVSVPKGAHGVLLSTVPANVLIPEVLEEEGSRLWQYACGKQIVFDFFEAPASPPNTSCLSGIHLPSFSGSLPVHAYVSMEVFGTTDMWDGARE
jgi:pimeloyl-ACP methyl ester carboxylesterase